MNLPQVMTWRAGPGGELTWHAGPARGCDVALRPRGRATAGPREAQVALTSGRRPRERVHADAREGRHVASEGFAYGGPTGIVGPLLERGAVTLIILYRRFPYLTAPFPCFYSVWDYVPTESFCCR